MSIRAYVLIQAEIGSAGRVANALRGKPGIQAADMVIGLHDVVAIIQGEDADAITKTVLSVIQTTKGVNHTTTYVVLNAGSGQPIE